MMDLFELVANLQGILNSIIPILIGLATLLFIYGLVRYIITKDPQTRRDAINTIIYGIVTLFIMVSIWSIVGIVAYSLGVDTEAGINTSWIPIDSLIIR